jgi:molybdopterin molybdotransferase
LTEFFHVITADRFLECLGGFPRLAGETVPLDDALGRTLSRDLACPEDLPEGARSTVDGFAVRARDTFGASDSIPALLTLGPPVLMGELPRFEIGAGEAAPIPTGGFLPPGADAVVMVEYTNPAEAGSIEVTRPVTEKANVLERGEDALSGTTLLATGKVLRPQELGFLAALGIIEVPVYRRPRVGVISSGDEIVPMDRRPRPGQVRDANSHAISALVRESGGIPTLFDIVPDDVARLERTLGEALAAADVVTMSGGSSVGARDLMLQAVSRLPEVELLAHGIAIRPGKPTLLARQGENAVVGLPGHPVSALVIAQIFLAPFLRYLQGAPLAKGPAGHRVQAVLATSVHSTIGLEEYIRVRLERDGEGNAVARPVFGKSGMLSTMVRADGIIRIPMNAEGLPGGEVVDVIEF